MTCKGQGLLLQARQPFLTCIRHCYWHGRPERGSTLKLSSRHDNFLGESNAYHCLATRRSPQCDFAADAVWRVLNAVSFCGAIIRPIKRPAFAGLLIWVASSGVQTTDVCLCRARTRDTSHHPGNRFCISGRVKRSSMRYTTPWSEVVRMTRPAACTTFCRPG